MLRPGKEGPGLFAPGARPGEGHHAASGQPDDDILQGFRRGDLQESVKPRVGKIFQELPGDGAKTDGPDDRQGGHRPGKGVQGFGGVGGVEHPDKGQRGRESAIEMQRDVNVSEKIGASGSVGPDRTEGEYDRKERCPENKTPQAGKKRFVDSHGATISGQDPAAVLLLEFAARFQVRAASQKAKSWACSGTLGRQSMKARRVKAWAGTMVPARPPLERMS